MSNLILKLTSKDTRQNTRNLLSSGTRNNLQGFLSKSGEQNDPHLSAQLLNDDDAAASATVTMNSSLETDNDVIQIGSMVLTAKSGSSTNPLAPNLASAAAFALLAGSGITNSGSTVINGNIGSSPTGTITGFPPGTVNGVTHSADATAATAKTDLTAAYVDLASRTPLSTSGVTDLGGATMNHGVYAYSSSVGITGTLTLDAQGNPNAVWIFQIGSTLTTAAASVVQVINGGSAGNVYWQVGSSATIDGASTFLGNVLALTSISLTGAGSTVNGRLLARNGAVSIANASTVTIVPGTVGGGVIVLSANQFLIGATSTDSATNLAAAINTDSNGLLTAKSVGAIVTVYAAQTGTMGNAIPIILTQVDPGGMVASGLALTGGLNDSAVAVDYRNF